MRIALRRAFAKGRESPHKSAHSTEEAQQREETFGWKMVRDRNLTSHVYNRSTAEAITGNISGNYLPAFQGLRQRLSALAAEPGPVMAELSRYMSAAAGRALPAEVVEKTKHHILDTLAAMITPLSGALARWRLSKPRKPSHSLRSSSWTA